MRGNTLLFQSLIVVGGALGTFSLSACSGTSDGTGSTAPDTGVTADASDSPKNDNHVPPPPDAGRPAVPDAGQPDVSQDTGPDAARVDANVPDVAPPPPDVAPPPPDAKLHDGGMSSDAHDPDAGWHPTK